MSEPFLEVNLEKSYRDPENRTDFQIRVDFTVNRGEFFSLIGPSGCGKTTLLRLITGLEAPDHGRVVMGGRDLAGVPTAKRRIGLVFQDYALFPHLNVQENIEYGLRIQAVEPAVRKRRRLELLEIFELGPLATRRLDQLSGGERQRVALARALAPQPLALLLDEPFAALDYGLRRRLRSELKDLQQRLGFTTIFVTHHQEEALALSDRLAVMENGRLLQTGSPREIYDRPGHAFTAGFLGDANLVPVTAGIAGAVTDEAARNGVDARGAQSIQVRVDGEIWLELAAQDGFLPGQYWLMIRPEDLAVHTLGDLSVPSNTPRLTARVSQVEYLGYARRLELQLQNHCLKAVLPKTGMDFKKGDPIRVVFDPKYARLISKVRD
jgi:spermidine/putrescine transport system ATP-binding protein